MDTIEYATFRYDTVEVENGLKTQENLKAKVSNVYDDKHLRCQHREAMPDGKHEQTIDFFGDTVFPAKKGAFDIEQVF